MVGMAVLWFSTFAKIRYTGPALAWSLAIALASSLTLAPVLVYWLRGVVFWPFAQRGAPPEHDLEPINLEPPPPTGFWANVASLVVGHPIAILTLCLLVMARWRSSAPAAGPTSASSPTSPRTNPASWGREPSSATSSSVS